MLFGIENPLYGVPRTRAQRLRSDLDLAHIVVPTLKMQSHNRTSFTINRGRNRDRSSGLNRLQVVGFRDHEGCMSPPMSFSKENHQRPEPSPMKRNLTNHDSGLTDISFDIASPKLEKSVYICGATRDVSRFHRGDVPTCTPSTLNERIISALSSHFYVRSNHGARDQTDEKHRKSSNAIAKCDAFVLLLSEAILEDASALSELILAKILHKVIIAVKEPGFALDLEAKEILTAPARTSILKAQYLLTQTDTAPTAKYELADSVFIDHPSTNILVSSVENPSPKKYVDDPCGVSFPVDRIIEELSRESLVYSKNSHEECFGKLLHKLSSIEEDRTHLPPVIEFASPVSMGEEESIRGTQNLSEIALMVPPHQERLSRVSSGYESAASPVPGPNDEKDGHGHHTEQQHSSSFMKPDNFNSDQSRAIKSANFNRLDSESSSGTTLPTIESNESPDNNSVSQPPYVTSRYQREPMKTSFPSVELPTAKRRSRSYETVSNWLSGTDFESPSFLETNYVVFPSQPSGPKVKPYLFRFPKDLRDNETSRRRDSFSTDMTYFHSKEEGHGVGVLGDSLFSSPVSSPLPPADGVPTVSGMKLMNGTPELLSGANPRGKHELPMKQQSQPIIRASSDLLVRGESGSRTTPKRTTSSGGDPRVASSRSATRDRQYLKLSTVRLEYSKSR